MPFRLRHDAKDWFKHVDGFEYDFDIYYFCLLAGLTENKKMGVPSKEAYDLVENFPGEYKEKGRLITAYFITRHIKSLGLDYSERDSIHNAIEKILETQSQSLLSEKGLKHMNEYANGGFDVLAGYFKIQPRHLETFLINFKKFITETLNK